MEKPSVQVFGQQELELRLKRGLPVGSHLISIGNPRRFWARRQADEFVPASFRDRFASVLRLEFFDQLELRFLRPEQPQRIPELRDVRKVFRYYQRTKDQASGYVVHCWSGVSRSAAVALGLLFLINGSEGTAARELMRIRRAARPHPGLVELWDRLLGSHLSEVNAVLTDERLNQMRDEIWRRVGKR